jgi:secretion/DNA translocation related TadE-like protein
MRGLAADEGAATIWSLALVNLLLLVGLVTAGIAGQAVTRQRAAAVADIAALAGAQSLSDPCAAAGGSAAANGMELATCASDGIDVVVDVRVAAPAIVARLLAFLGREAQPITARARAGAPP